MFVTESLSSLANRTKKLGVSVCIGVDEMETDRGRINQLRCTMGAVPRDQDSLYNSLSKYGDTEVYELRALVAHHIGSHRDRYRALVGTTLQPYIESIERGSWGSVHELQAFGEARSCSTFCYHSNTKMWISYTEGGLLNGHCVALYLEAGYFMPLPQE